MRPRLLAMCLGALLAACGEAEGPQSGPADARTTDASTAQPDAAGSRPDGGTGLSDAAIGAPDARLADAPIGAPDGATSQPDARPGGDGPIADSGPAVVDGPVPDSGPPPDARVFDAPPPTPDSGVPDAPPATPDAGGTVTMFPLRVDPTGRGLEDQAGRPFYIVGDAAWSMIVELTSTELETYLADRRARGFNTLLVELIEHKFGGPLNRAGQAPFLVTGDISTPNDAYFDQAHAFVQRAGSLGFLVLLTPMYLGFPNTDEGWFVELTQSGVAKARAYGQYVGQRFDDLPNVIWVQGGDRPPDDALDEVNAIAAELAAAGATQLQTAHSIRFHSAIDDYDQPWLALNTTYSDCGSALADLQNDMSTVTDRPSLFLEGRYENESSTTACLVGQPYYALLAGERGHVFGNNPIWLFGAGWPQALDSQGARIMQHQAALLASRPLAHLVADTQVVTGSVAGLAAARDQSGETAIALIPSGGQTVQIDPSAFTPTSVVAWWFNPLTGTSQAAGQLTGVTSLTSPEGGPWVLVLDRSDAGFGPPG